MDDRFKRHFNHDIVIAKYTGLDDEPVNYSVECEDCHEVIIDDEAFAQLVSPPFQVAEGGVAPLRVATYNVGGQMYNGTIKKGKPMFENVINESAIEALTPEQADEILSILEKAGY